MSMETLVSHLPMALFIGLGILANYLLMRYKNSRDLQAWMRRMRADAARAAQDETFRTAQLAEAEAELARLPTPETVQPMRRNQELFLIMMPKFIFIAGVASIVIIFLGLFRPVPEDGGNGMLYVGLCLLAATAGLIAILEKMLKSYARLRQLNRKYILLKTGADSAAQLAALDEILKYYPNVPELRLERGDRLAVAERLDEAIAAVQKAEELAPGNVDFKMVELTFQLRNNNEKAAAELIERIGEMKRPASDPRLDVYSAALELRRGDAKAAIEHAEKAFSLDETFAKRIIEKDTTLKNLYNTLLDRGLMEKANES